MRMDGLVGKLLRLGTRAAERRVEELGEAIVEAAGREMPGVEARVTNEGVEVRGERLRERVLGTRSVLPDLALAALVLGVRALRSRR